jgi:5-formyltetrahydrofolate cyclo-ligase
MTSSTQSESIEARKTALRQEALARRDALAPERRADAAQVVAARALPIAVKPGKVVSGYSPLKSEINPVPLMRCFEEAGAGLALPVVQGRGQPLLMRAWRFGAPLGSGVWGIREPLADAPQVFPDVLIVPLLAFDRSGNRIGYGAGYYDKTITLLRTIKPVTAIGLAFACQEVEDVPVTPRDARLDLVLTEDGEIDCRKISTDAHSIRG